MRLHKLSAGFCVLASLLLGSCSKEVDMAGGSVGAGNAFVAGQVLGPDGLPASNTAVALMPSDFNPVLHGVPASVVTGFDGRYALPAVSGLYNLQFRSLSAGTVALIRAVHITSEMPSDTFGAPSATLGSPGSIQVSLANLNAATDGHLYVPGTLLKTRLDSAAIAAGQTALSQVPAGDLPGLLYFRARDTATAIPVSPEITVLSGQTVPVAKAAPVSVIFSAGVLSGPLYSGTASAANGLMTLTTAAPDNMGVGDEVRTMAGRFFIQRRNSSVSFKISGDAARRDTVSFGPQSVTVRRAFSGLGQALDAQSPGPHAADSLHLNGADLLAGNIRLSIACYADGEDVGFARVRGFVTSPINFIRIFTPAADSETGVSQRHRGRWRDAAYRIRRATTDVEHSALFCEVRHLKIEGLQVAALPASGSGTGIFFYEQGNGEFDVSHCIIRADYSGKGASGRGIYVYNNSGSGPFIRIWNNIIYGFSDSIDAGIQLHFPNTAGVLANNTFVNCYFGVSGFVDRVVLKNNLAQGCRRGYFPWNQLNPENDYNISNSIEWDLDALHSKDTVRVLFADSANADFHLAPSDTVARNCGQTAPVPGAAPDDIDGEARVAPWDIGADEVQ